jgi:hypothetical protein
VVAESYPWGLYLGLDADALVRTEFADIARVGSGAHVAGGDLEGLEEDAGAAGVEGVGGDAGEDFAEGNVEVGRLVDGRHGERMVGEARARRLSGLAVGWWWKQNCSPRMANEPQGLPEA